MKKNFLLACAALLIAAATSLRLSAQPTSGTLSKNIRWELRDSTLTISGSGAMPSYGPTASERIPWTDPRIASRVAHIVIGEGITEVGNYNFGYRPEIKQPRISADMGYYASQGAQSSPLFVNAKSITLPSTLRKIKNHAFSRIPIRAIHIPEGLTEIGSGAFANTGLLSVILPASLRNVSSEAFSGCSALQAVDFNGTPLKLSAGMFFDCDKLRMLLHTANIRGVKPSTFAATALMDLSDEEILDIFHTDGLKPYVDTRLPARTLFSGSDADYETLRNRAIDEFYVREAKNATSLFQLDRFTLSPYDRQTSTATLNSVNHGSFLLPLSERQYDLLLLNLPEIISTSAPVFIPDNGRVTLQSVTFTVGDKPVATSPIQ